MATYTTFGDVDGEIQSRRLYKGTSKKKATEIAKAFTEGQAYACQFVKYNEPMPVVGWNDAFQAYVESRGRNCYEGMTHY